MAISGAGLQSIYQRLNSAAEYHPLEADTFADWSLEAGDIVTVTRDGTGYQSPVHSATHVWKGQQTVRIASGGDEKRESVARMSRRKYAGSGSGVRSAGVLGNRITMVYNGLSAEIIQTESEMSTRMTDMYNGLESFVEQTASHWDSELVDVYNGLSSKVEQTASQWSSELQDAYNGLDSKVEQTASQWSSELNSAYNGLSSKVEQTASTWNVRLADTYTGLSSRISATDGKVEAEASARQSDVTDIKGRLIVEAGKAGLVAEVTDSREILYLPDRSVFPTVGQADKIYLDVSEETYYEYKNGTYVVTTPGKTIRAGEITTAINEAGESEAHIDAQKVYIGNSKSTTVISGKLDAADLTADLIAAKIGQLNVLEVKELNSPGEIHALEFTGGDMMLSGDMDVTGDAIFSGDLISESGVYDNSNGSSRRINLIDASVSGNVLTITRADGDPITFSKATSLSGEWSSNTYVVTASPQGNTITTSISSRFGADQGNYYIEAYRSADPGAPGISGSGITYRLVKNASGTIEMQDTGGTRISNTPTLSLQDKTVTTNGTFTPDEGYIGMSSVTVNVQTGTTLEGAWNSGVLTVTASPQQVNYTAQLSAAATTWDGNTGSRVIWDGTAPDAQHGRLTGYTVSVDATVRYNAGVTDGKNAVTINKGSWSSGQISFTKSEGTASTKTVQLTAAAATWDGNTASVKMWDGTAADAQHGSDTGYTVTVDASARYNAGVTAGKNAVTINKGSWSGGKVQFSKSEGTASNSGVLVSLGGSWSGNSYNYTIYDNWSGSAASTGYTGTIDATARYNAGYSAGESAGYSSGYSAGSNSVTPTASIFNGASGDPGSAFEQRSISQSDGAHWYTYTANSSNGKYKNYKLYVDATSYGSAQYNSGYTAGYTTGYSTGESTGYYSGYSAGESAGYSSGYSAGQSAGYSSGVTDGKNAVTINKSGWSGGKVTFSKSEGTASNSGVQLSLSGSWAKDGSACKYNYTINDSWSGTAGSTGYTGSITANPWINPADHEVNHQGNLAYDTLYGITLAGYTLATWRTQAKGGGGSHSVSLSVDIGWTGSLSGYNYVRAYSASSLARTYIRVAASCGNSSVKRYWTIN